MDTRFRTYYLVTFNHRWWAHDYESGESAYNDNQNALFSLVPDLKMTSPNWQYGIVDRYYNRKVSCLKEDEDMLVNALKTLEPNGVEWVKIDQDKYLALHAKRNRSIAKRNKAWEELRNVR